VDVPLQQQLDKQDLVTLWEARRLAVHQARQVVADCDQAIKAQIKVASDKRLQTMNHAMVIPRGC
jgi:hypothetical protein